MTGNFLIRRYSIGIIILFFVFSSCIKTEVVDNVELNQEFSLPLGEKELSIAVPDWTSSTNVPGTFGSFFYNGRPYQLNRQYFQKEEQIDFRMDSISKLNWIQKVEFKIRVQNSFPLNAYIQIYVLNANKQIADSVFLQGKQLAKAGTVNILDEVDEVAVTIFNDATFEGDRLARLKTTKYLSYVVYINTQREDRTQLRFTNQSNIKINMAMRLVLKYNLNEI